MCVFVKFELCKLLYQWVVVRVLRVWLCTQHHCALSSSFLRAVPAHFIGCLHPCPIMFMHCKRFSAYQGQHASQCCIAPEATFSRVTTLPILLIRPSTSACFQLLHTDFFCMAGINIINVAWLQDLHGMIDAAKYADLVLLMVDGGFGFEMETFEFLNLLQVRPATPSSCCVSDLCRIAAAIPIACTCMNG